VPEPSSALAGLLLAAGLLPACCAGNARNAVSGRYSASPEWLPLMVVVSAKRPDFGMVF
jgi:hypothetical protein